MKTKWISQDGYHEEQCKEATNARCGKTNCLHPASTHWTEPDGTLYHCRIADCPCEQYTEAQP